MIAFSRKHSYWVICIVSIICAAIYWSVFATDRYVSEATVVLKNARTAPLSATSLSSLLTGGGSQQLLVLREYLLSTDMLKKLNTALGLRVHYSSEDIDFLSRLSSPDLPLEQFHEYYLSRVTVVLDDYAHVLRIRAEAFDPEIARAIVNMLLREGEQWLNAMNQRLAATQIEFIKDQVDELKHRLEQARQALLVYQNTHKLISPTGAVETLNSVVATLLGELTTLKAQKEVLAATHSQKSPAIMRLHRKINALRSQIGDLRSRMASNSETALNRQSAEYQKLRMKLKFAKKMYTGALTALQSTRVQAASSLKQIAIVQSPTSPDYANAPDRLHNIMVFAVLAVLAALIVHLLAVIVRDHTD